MAPLCLTCCKTKIDNDVLLKQDFGLVIINQRLPSNFFVTSCNEQTPFLYVKITFTI